MDDSSRILAETQARIDAARAEIDRLCDQIDRELPGAIKAVPRANFAVYFREWLDGEQQLAEAMECVVRRVQAKVAVIARMRAGDPPVPMIFHT